MSIHQPPQKLSSIFNNSDYISNDKPLTIDEASKSFITYPTAQGKINLLDVDVGGTADFKAIPKTSLAPVDNEDLTNKEYVDGLIGNIVTVDTTQTITGAKTFSNNVIMTGTLTTSGNTTFGDTESDQTIVNSYTWLKNDIRFGNDELTDTLINQCRSNHQAVSVFTDFINSYAGQTDIYATQGLYLGQLGGTGRAVLGCPNNGTVNGFQFVNFDKDGNILNSPFYITGDGTCVANYKFQVSSNEFKVVNGTLVTLPVDSVSQSAVNGLTADLLLKANDIDVVHLTGDEAINGNKTFGNNVTVNGDLSYQDSSLNIINVETEMDLKAFDSEVVHNTGDETISGNKTFSNNVIVSGTLTTSGNTTFGDAESDTLIVNSTTTLKNDVVIGDDAVNDLLNIKSRTIGNGMATFRNNFLGTPETDKMITSGLYLGATSSGHGILAVPNVGAVNGFQFRNMDKDCNTLNTPFIIYQDGSCSFSGNVSVTGTLSNSGDTTFGSTESNQTVVNSYTWLKNDIRFGDNELTDTLLNQCRSNHQAVSVFTDAINSYGNQIDIYATQGLYLGQLGGTGRAVLGCPNNGTTNGFQFSNFDKDGNILNTPFYITAAGECVSNYKFQVSSDEFKVIDGTLVTLPVDSVSQSAVNGLTADLLLKANDSEVVHNTGDETIAGIKTFSDKGIFNGDVDIGNDETSTFIVKSNTKYLGQTIFTNDITTHVDIGASFPESGVYIGRQPGNIGTFVSGSNGGTGGFQFLNKDIDGITINTPLTINRAGNTTIGGDLYAQNKLITNVIEGVGTTDVSINSNGGLIKFTSNLNSNIEMAADGTTTMYKKFYAQDIGTIQEGITPVSIATGNINVDYSVNGVIYVQPIATAGTFLTTITNVNPQQTGNKSCIITLLIDASGANRYCDAVSVNGSIIPVIFNGGIASVDVSGASLIHQTIAIIYTSSGTVPSFVMSSVNSYFT